MVLLYNQTGRFTELCSVYAPFYHQRTLGTYDPGGYRSTEFYNIACNDVDEAFSQCIRESGEHPLVLSRHSQGSHMLLELLLQRLEILEVSD